MKTTAKNLIFWLSLFIFAIAAVYLLWAEHRAHLVGMLPVLLLLFCLVMHIFMHESHGSGHGGGNLHQDGSDQNHEN